MVQQGVKGTTLQGLNMVNCSIYPVLLPTCCTTWLCSNLTLLHVHLSVLNSRYPVYPTWFPVWITCCLLLAFWTRTWTDSSLKLCLIFCTLSFPPLLRDLISTLECQPVADYTTTSVFFPPVNLVSFFAWNDSKSIFCSLINSFCPCVNLSGLMFCAWVLCPIAYCIKFRRLYGCTDLLAYSGLAERFWNTMVSPFPFH